MNWLTVTVLSPVQVIAGEDQATVEGDGISLSESRFTYSGDIVLLNQA
jgi:hypothetical protein